MKRVLITGLNSYIGCSFESWARQQNMAQKPQMTEKSGTSGAPAEMEISMASLRGNAWKSMDFSVFDSIFHVAGIAHADVGHVSEEKKRLYYRVNTELTLECARKARAEGVRQFIYMSSMIVYGNSGGIGEKKVITGASVPAPADFYGDSKLRAEKGLLELETEDFRIVILRPPMIYGKGSKGNYPILAKMAAKLPVFPREKNERSMLYIGNLCKLVSLLILNEERGIFYPQNREYVCTSELVRMIGKARGKRVRLWGIFHPFLIAMGRLGGKAGGMVNKAFGNFTYEMGMSTYREEYRIYDLPESVRLTEDHTMRKEQRRNGK